MRSSMAVYATVASLNRASLAGFTRVTNVDQRLG
jgi:hypothetical protein